MAEGGVDLYLNPITLESKLFIHTLERHGAQYQVIDEELLNTMDQLIDAINNFYDQCKTQIDLSGNLKLVKANELDSILRSYTCMKCKKYLGPSAEKAAKHITGRECICVVDDESHSKKKFESTSTKNERHRNQEKDAKKKPKKLTNLEVKLPKKAKALLSIKRKEFLEDAIDRATEMKHLHVYDDIESEILELIKPLYPEKSVKIYKFGSRLCGIGNENSDLDVFIDIDDSFHNFENRASQRTLSFITNVYTALKKSNNWARVISIESARVPIIRAVHQKSQIPCDLGFSNSLGHCNTSLMEYYFKLQPIAPRMCIYFKRWRQCCKLSDVFTTYSLTLMVIYFLQHIKLLPSVETLQKKLSDDEKIMVGPWISNFQRLTLAECSLKPMMEPTTENVRNMILDFFTFLGNFDYENCVFCPYFAISSKCGIAKLPKRYDDFVRINGPQAEIELNRPCVVQDPIQLNHNVTKNVSFNMLKLFINFAKKSADKLRKNMHGAQNDIST